MPGLGQLPDAEFIDAFQAIHRAIMNPLFIGGAFMGGAASLVAATAAHRRESGRFRLLAAASAVYVLGVVGVTIAGNVPLNEKLAKLSAATASGAEMAAARSDFEAPWNRLHLVRTGAAVGSLVLPGLAMMTRDEQSRGGSATVCAARRTAAV
ncbi:MAG: DUF1772 domain-containing protein [Pseudonocardia sp.]|nr:DUF1772 domain-containing protein [Pseudonocardia sp.]